VLKNTDPKINKKKGGEGRAKKKHQRENENQRGKKEKYE
jgi:hypothetical protein